MERDDRWKCLPKRVCHIGEGIERREKGNRERVNHGICKMANVEGEGNKDKIARSPSSQSPRS